MPGVHRDNPSGVGQRWVLDDAAIYEDAGSNALVASANTCPEDATAGAWRVWTHSATDDDWGPDDQQQWPSLSGT